MSELSIGLLCDVPWAFETAGRNRLADIRTAANHMYLFMQLDFMAHPSLTLNLPSCHPTRRLTKWNDIPKRELLSRGARAKERGHAWFESAGVSRTELLTVSVPAPFVTGKSCVGGKG